MSTTLSKNETPPAVSLATARWRSIRTWLLTWELYPILLIAGFLRLYRLDSTEFDADQADIFRMAHDAIAHGLLPATSNIASIRILNPPAVIYLLMLPAALSTDPFWGVVFVGLLNIAAVLLTYFFVRRYYGRTAGTIAALLYAVAVKPLVYSRFLWQQNMIAPLIVLFLCALFWGAVEKRKGWLFPALLFLCVLYQLHETTAVLAILLVVAFILAPRTVRWRDVLFGVLALIFLFFTYFLWQISNNFGDVFTVLKVAKFPSHIDNQALLYYRLFFNPYGLNTGEKPPTNPHLLVSSLVPALLWVRRLMIVLVIGGLVVALMGLLFNWLSHQSSFSEPAAATSRPYLKWWTDLCNSPYRCGLLLLLVWQIVPLLVLSRHSVPIYPYYLLMLMPGPFILIGLCLAKLVEFIQASIRQGRWLRYAVYIVAGFLVIMQLVGSTAALLDDSNGNTRHGVTYNTLDSLQHAVSEADQLAQQRHLNHLYIATDEYTRSALDYLAEQIHTPVTLFDSSRCLVLPSPADGPAVLLVGPADTLTNALLHQYASATLIDQPERLGSVPFQLYIVNSLAEFAQVASSSTFVQNLQLLDPQAHHLHFDNTSWVVTHWGLLRTAGPTFDTTYSYFLTALSGGHSRQSFLNFSSLRAGDQLFVAFDLSGVGSTHHGTPSMPLTITGTFHTVIPHILSYGPLQLETFVMHRTPTIALQTLDGKKSILLSLA